MRALNVFMQLHVIMSVLQARIHHQPYALNQVLAWPVSSSAALVTHICGGRLVSIENRGHLI